MPAIDLMSSASEREDEAMGFDTKTNNPIMFRFLVMSNRLFLRVNLSAFRCLQAETVGIPCWLVSRYPAFRINMLSRSSGLNVSVKSYRK